MASSDTTTTAPEVPPPDMKKLQSLYLGLAFFLHITTTVPNSVINQNLVQRLLEAEQQLELMRARRKEDTKANARVVEIFATHRNAWQQEERRLQRQIQERESEAAGLREKLREVEEVVQELRREVSERGEMVEFMSRRMFGEGDVGLKFDAEVLGSSAAKFSSEGGGGGGNHLWQV